jgi:hypothetical protein
MHGNTNKRRTHHKIFDGESGYMPEVDVSQNGDYFQTNVYWFFFQYVLTQHIIRIMKDNIWNILYYSNKATG